MHNAQSGRKYALAEQQNSTRNMTRLSAAPYPAPSRQERTEIALSLLNTLHIKIPALIATEPAHLAEDTASLEKQLCALCSYTAYCNMIKNPTDKKAQTNLTEQVNRVLGTLIKRIKA